MNVRSGHCDKLDVKFDAQVLTLSVSISPTTSSSLTVSPTAFSHLMSPSVIDSAKGGTFITRTSLPADALNKIEVG